MHDGEAIVSDITVIGLGMMGAALARAIQRAGHKLTVWNRSADKMQPFIDAFEEESEIRRYANVIHSADFENCTATLRVWRAAMQCIQTQGQDAGINTDFPDYVDSLLGKAVDAGYGEKHVMALVEVLRKGSGT
jgi:3-hydroxyisobutyrate dehydrogenase-like beta-hydroxyacid dehydrogenase